MRTPNEHTNWPIIRSRGRRLSMLHKMFLAGARMPQNLLDEMTDLRAEITRLKLEVKETEDDNNR